MTLLRFSSGQAWENVYSLWLPYCLNWSKMLMSTESLVSNVVCLRVDLFIKVYNICH